MYFDFRTEVLLFMRIWLIFATLVGVPIVLVSLRRAMAGDSDAWMGVGIPVALIAWGFVLPKIGNFFGVSERDYLSRFVEQALGSGNRDRRAYRKDVAIVFAVVGELNGPADAETVVG